MTAHPYPQKVVRAVEEVVFAYYNRSDGLDAAAVTTVEMALSTLWRLDSPHTLSADEAGTIWAHAVKAYNGDPEGMHSLRTLLAAHAPDWGNQRSTND